MNKIKTNREIFENSAKHPDSLPGKFFFQNPPKYTVKSWIKDAIM